MELDGRNRFEPDARQNNGIHYLDPPIKSESDKKEYRVIKLANGLTALLISDFCLKSNFDAEGKPQTGDIAGNYVNFLNHESWQEEEKLASCSLTLDVGNFSDPEEVYGLALCLKHMIVAGSEKYPQENDFDEFVKTFDGFQCAIAEGDHTTFFFEIKEDYLLPAVDRFTQLFINPLLKRNAFNKIKQAAANEFQLNEGIDCNRKHMLLGSLLKPGHPASRFLGGNLKIIQNYITDDKLFEAQFCLDVLETYVKDYFSAIPNNGLLPDDLSRFDCGVTAFDIEKFRKIYKMKPVDNTCEVMLSWIMPPEFRHRNDKVHRYAAWILGHEGKGSLANYFRKKLWCLELSAGIKGSSFESNSFYSLFNISVTLTDEGRKHLREILDSIFSYINLLHRKNPCKSLYDEIKRTMDFEFRFVDELPVNVNTYFLSWGMQKYSKSTDYVIGKYLCPEFNQQVIKDYLQNITPDNVNIMIADKQFDDAMLKNVEPRLRTKYICEEIPTEWVDRWRTIEPYAEFHLPEPNTFLPDDFSLISPTTDIFKYPVEIYHDEIAEIWYKPDYKYKRPQCYMNVLLIFECAFVSPKHAVVLDVLIPVLKHLLAEQLYPASLAKLNHSIDVGSRSMTIKVNGFNQKVPSLLHIILKYLVDLPNLVTEELFNSKKATKLKEYRDHFILPSNLIWDVHKSITVMTNWTTVDKHAVLSTLEFDEFKFLASMYLSRASIRFLAQGNILENEVIECGKKCLGILNCRPALRSAFPQQRNVQLPPGQWLCKVKNIDPSVTMSAVMNYYQVGFTDQELRLKIELLTFIMKQQKFDKLRIQHQLGNGGMYEFQLSLNVIGLIINIVKNTDKFTTENIDENIDAFLKSFLEALEKMSEEEFRDFQDSLIKNDKLSAEFTLSDEVSKNWVEIVNSYFNFDAYEKEIDDIKKLTLEDVKECMKNYFINGPNMRKLSIHVIGATKSDLGEVEEITEDIKSFAVTETEVEKLEKLKSNLENVYQERVKSFLDRNLKLDENDSANSGVRYIVDVEHFKHTLPLYPIHFPES
ncbi:nardilysin isoform X2 [Orussus abietinus]|uniref:nardilysin isoform X2 n=1 Tax=Orussus abietinus TaxID=222816 RepID=UPI000625FE30|nr:nardilysin isoform X2 [Orussus abietinus]